MSQKIHYDDNIFFLTAMIRTLNDAVKINVDADFFGDKILEDTMFVDASIQKIYSSLKENTHLIRRNAHMHSVMKLKRAYGRLLDDLLTVEGAFSPVFKTIRPKLRRIASVHMDDVKLIRNNLEDSRKVKIDTDMISYNELHFLMNSMDEEQES